MGQSVSGSAPAEQSEREYRKVINAWSMFDWANSAFATTIMAAVYPVYYRGMALAAGKSEADATASWSYMTSFSLLLIAILGPFLGTLSDCAGGKKKYLVWFSALGIAGTAAMVFLGPASYKWGALLFIIGNLGFSGSNIFYEALLPHIARENDLDRVSSRGYAIGYLGGGLLLILNLLWLARPEWFFLPNREAALPLCFLSVAVWWALFTIPLWKHVPEPPAPVCAASLGELARLSFQQLARTFRNISKYKQLILFLAAFWIYNDAIGTIIKIATVYGDEIGVDQNAMIVALVLTQFIGIPCAIGFGSLAGKIGTKRSILLGLVVYILISVFGYFMKNALHFYILACLVGLVQGGTQALSRSLFAMMVPKKNSAEFFGFYSTGAKFAGIIGPALFGIVAQMSGSSRPAIVSLSILFVIGGALLFFVNEGEGKRVAEAVDQQA